MTAHFQYRGPSSDGRTNVWLLTLPCGHKKAPLSTMFDKQHVQCDECLKRYLVDYSKQVIEDAA